MPGALVRRGYGDGINGKTAPRRRRRHRAPRAYPGRGLRGLHEEWLRGTSTLEIATRARVSKRELYTQVGNKQEMLIACISERARRLQAPADLPVPRDRQTLAHLLAAFGAQLLREITDPAVIAVFRLAIAEAVHAPEVARALDSIGRETSRAALRTIMARAQTSGLLKGRPAELAEQFGGLLWGTFMVSLLLGVVERPNPREIAGRAHDSATAFLQLHPRPNDAATPC